MDASSAERWMREAIRLSRKGFPAPNPRVGCVIVKGNRIVGRGHHPYAGGPHAEVVALREAGAQSRGAHLFVTLEPCRHHGKTPPCTQALIQAGVGYVTVAQLDPTPDAGGGLQELEAAGIPVTVGVLASEAASVNGPWLMAVRRRWPYVALKVACSLDGIIHSSDSPERWITSPSARRAGHRLRAELGCVLVGSRTVEVDDPQLTARLPGVRRQPLRVVLDPTARLNSHFRVFDQSAETIRLVAGMPRQDGDVSCSTNGGAFDTRALLDILWQRGVTGVLVEGGARTHRAFLEAGCCDALEMFVSPKVLGSGLRWFDPLSGQELGNAGMFELVSARRVGSDAWLRFRPLSVQ